MDKAMVNAPTDDQTTAAYWNLKTGEHGDPYRRYVLNPAMFELLGAIAGKVVLDVGCTNGYLAKQFVIAGAQKVICIDKSPNAIAYAINNTKAYKQVECIVQDIEKPLNLEDQSIDLVYSSMVLHQIEDLETVQNEVCRVLKDDGEYVFSITHPAHALCAHTEEELGKTSKYIGLGGYFEELMCNYRMRSDEEESPECIVPYYHRTLEQYFNTTIMAGFEIAVVAEPPINEELLKAAPQFIEYRDRPASLVFCALKSE
jgi:ubiquinone/menaquinone biosynthesis C-methylase UbiE